MNHVGLPVWLAVLWLVNLGISFWNARAVGQVWIEAKHVGTSMKVLVWCGAIMSACGFIWCYAIIEAFIGNWLFPDTVTPEVMQYVFELTYLIIIFPVLGSGFAIWAHSLYHAWVRRDFASVGFAAWNSFAQAHNTYQAFRGVPEAWKDLGGLFGGEGKSNSSSSDNKGGGAAGLVVVLIALAAVILGILTTFAIIYHYAGSRPLPDNRDLSRERRRRVTA